MRQTLTILSLLCLLTASAQQHSSTFNSYIKEYSSIAVEQMNRYEIPASITLAQGLLESGAGQSDLAIRSNNHFGIKCHNSWTGNAVYHDDDERGECFRAYTTVEESYEDHSLFLKNSQRYASLFELKVTDYKGWARGLKKAGYATDPSYANRLITLIEDYELYKYDTEKMSKSERRRLKKLLKEQPWLFNPHQVYIANDLAYVVAREGDTFRLLGGEFDISWKKLAKYNDLHKNYTLVPGDIIYLKEKNKKAQIPHLTYTVREGDSMHSISQKYGIRLKYLYKMNDLDDDYLPEVGAVLKLR